MRIAPYAGGGHPDDERLIYDSMAEAVEAQIDQLNPTDAPRQVMVQGFRRMVPSVGSRYVTESMWENLDEEYGDEDGTPIEPDDKDLLDRLDRLAALICEANYEPWTCEPAGPPIFVEVEDWIRKNRPRWLEDSKWSFRE